MTDDGRHELRDADGFLLDVPAELLRGPLVATREVLCVRDSACEVHRAAPRQIVSLPSLAKARAALDLGIIAPAAGTWRELDGKWEPLDNAAWAVLDDQPRDHDGEARRSCGG